MSWVSAADTAQMSGNEQVRVHFAESCLANPGLDQISQAIAAAGNASGGGSVASVADVSGDFTATMLNPFSVLTQFYVATINPVDGASYAQLRADVLNALTALAQSAGISCSNFTVGQIEYNDGAGFIGTAVCGPGGCGTGFKFASSTVIVLAVAAVAILVLLKF